jgi:hypothetical protein
MRSAPHRGLLVVFGDVPLNQLTSEMIDAFRAHLVDENRLTAARTSSCPTESSNAPNATGA